MKKRIILILTIVLSLIMTSCTTDATIKEPEQTNGELNLFVKGSSDRATMGYEYAVEEFKRLYPDVKVNLELPVAEMHKEAQQELATKIMAGNAPDVLLLEPAFLRNTDIHKLMNNNYFTDLNPYLEADSDYKKEEYHQGIIKGGEIDEKQYIMPLSYGVPAMFYDKNLIEEKNINIDNKNFESFFEELVRINEKDKDIELIYNGEMKATYIFEQYSSFSGIKNFDYINKKAEFNEEIDKNIADMTNKLYSNFEKSMLDYDALPRIKDKNLLFLSYMNTIEPVMGLSQCAIIKGFSEPDFKFIKDVNDEMVGSIKIAVGIYNGSANKQNAYNFMKILMGDKVQFDTQLFLGLAMATGGGFPIKNTRVKNLYKYCEMIGKYPLPKKPLDQEFYDRFYEESQKITNAIMRTPWDDKYYEIMLPYFKGEKTYEECFDLVKAQARIYINE